MPKLVMVVLVTLVLTTMMHDARGAEKTELRLVGHKSAGSRSDCTHDLVLASGGARRIEDPGCTAVLSPDGKWIALRSHGGQSGFILYDTAKDAYMAAITFHAGTDVGKFVWSPDGSALAFTTVNQDSAEYPMKSKLFIYDIVAKKKVKVDVQAFRSCGAICIASTPEWSPDGKTIKVVEVDRERMFAGRYRYERDVEFDRMGKRLITSSWR